MFDKKYILVDVAVAKKSLHIFKMPTVTFQETQMEAWCLQA